MRLSTAIKRKHQLVRNIRELYETAVQYKWEAEKIDRKYYEILSEAGKIPEWLRSYLSGYRDSILWNIESTMIEFCYTVDGNLYSIWKESPRHYEKYFTPEYVNKNHSAYAFYWKNTEKPYSTIQGRMRS